MAEVVFEEVTKIFPGDVVAVDALSLSIRDGELLVLLGPSGCGKTTTVRMAAGLEEPTSGTIRIAARVANDIPPEDRDIAMVFQSYALYPHMSAYANMAFPLRMRKVPRSQIDRRVREAASILGIEQLLRRKPRSLSGGQRQRVALGKAIVRRPAAFLLDEPLSNLDAKLRLEMRAEIKRLHRRTHSTTIYVTHDQEEAMTLGDRIAVMHKGVLHQCGRPMEVYDCPADRFVAGFVGTPAMNFLRGSLLNEDGAVWFTDGEWKLRMPDLSARISMQSRPPDVVLGARPEAVGIRPEGRFAGPDNALPAKVDLVEPLGDRVDIHASINGQLPFVARVDAHQHIPPQGPTRLFLDMRKTHLFEPGPQGRNITRAD